MTLPHDELADILARGEASFGLLSHQASPLADILHARCPKRFKALFSAEHGWFGDAAPGEATHSSVHPAWHIPVHALYGATRTPAPEMLDGLDLVVADLQDLGVRCYTYLATLRNLIAACAPRGIPVVVPDRPVPLGGVVDGPMPEAKWMGFVCPAHLPLCHGMTFAEEAMFLARDIPDARVVPVPLRDWSHADRTPWPGFMPPSPGIRSWDAAVLYPMTVFTEAFPAIGTDRAGNLAFRVLNAPWLDAARLVADIETPLAERGVTVREYRIGGVPGVLFSVADPNAWRPVEAGLVTLCAILRRHPKEATEGARPEWLAKLLGTDVYAQVNAPAALERLFARWAEDRAAFDPVNLYAR